MYTLKDKVAGSLSRLVAGSPEYDSRSSPSDMPQARWYSKGSKAWSSVFSFINPSVNIDGSTSIDHHGDDLRPDQSGWENKKFEVEDESLSSCKEYTITFASDDLKKVREDLEKACEDNSQNWLSIENKQVVSPRGKDKDQGSERSSSGSDEYQEARERQSPLKPQLNLSDESVFINDDLYEFLVSSLPNIVKGCQWVLLYSTLKHGISLRTLIRKSAELHGPCLLITGDRQGAVFGAMLECPLKPTPKRKYQGTNQTFVFTTIYGAPRLFRPTGANRYYYICLNDLLAFGGGGSFALSLEGDLLNGSSGPSETFGNLCLAHNEDFELRNVELWGFSHSFNPSTEGPLRTKLICTNV